MKRFRMISMVAMTILLLDLVVGSPTGRGTLLFGTAEAQTSTSLTRGPYLQLSTPNSIVVRWRTGAATDSRVIYGLQPGALTQTASSSTSATNHEVTLQGLTPATRYYYAVGTSSQILAGGTGGFPFTTSPPAGTAQPTRVWVIGDAGTASSSQRAVRDAYTRFNQGGRTDLWLMLGDNAYSDGTDSQYQSAVFNVYPEMLRTAVVWPTLGNHDAHSADSGSQSGPYYSIFTLPKRAEAGGLASGTEAYYSFDYANIHFICLDSQDSSRSTSGAMLNWLRADLTATDQNWIIAYWHHPPYSKGSHNSDSDSQMTQMRQNVLPILEQGGVDLVLTGHSHSYERSFLLDRHYGSSSSLTSAMKLDGGNGRVDGTGAYEKASPGPAPHEGAVYVVAGSAGQTGGGSLNHPAMFVSFNTLGSVALDVNGPRLDAKFIDSGGSVKDHFTIMRGASTPVPPPAGPSELVATAVSSSRADLAWRDNATNETGFHVDRCAGSACTIFARVATVPANATRYTDGGLTPATTYRYRVSAFNTGGESTPSNMSSMTTLSPPPPGATLFEDDFEDGAAQGWTSAGGTWSVATDGTRVYQESSTSGDAVAGAGDPGWLDYAVEARVRPVGFNSAGGFVKLLGRYKDGNNYVYALLRNTSILELKKKLNGTSVSLGTKALGVTPGAWYTVKLELLGPSVKVWVNGTLQMEGTDPSPSGGMVGVGTYNASASFDDVVVEPLTTTPPPPPGPSLFEDNFEDGAAQGWTSAGGTWSVATDGTRVYQESNPSGDAVAGAGNLAWLDYAVEARVRPVGFNSAGGFVKLLGRYKDGNNYVYALLRNTSVLELKKKVNGTSVSLGTKSLSVTPGAWYTVKLELLGPSVKVWVNGTLQMVGTDPSPSGGMVGVGTYNASASFDDVVVRTP